MVSLGQAAVLSLGAWVAARLLFATSMPFEIVLVLSGLITMVLGTLVGLPALRLSGLYLALITLMLAGAITVVLATTNFPNGGHGFLGYNGAALHIPAIRRPGIATTDKAFFRYSVIVAALMFMLVIAHLRTRPGRAWVSIRQSETAALAAGINTTLYKLWAFALASFITGVAGGLLAGADKYLYSIDFQTQDSITLLAVVLMGGVFSVWGAVVAAILMQFLPALLQNIGVNSDWLIILFGVGVLQVLSTAPAGIVDQMPKDLAKLGRLIVRAGRAVDIRRGARDDRGLGPDRQVRRRHLARRNERHLRVRHMRPDRPQRRRQDDLLQRPQRVRQARDRQRQGVRRGPALDRPLSPGPLGGAPHLSDRAGDRGPDRLQQRRDGARELGRRRDRPGAPTCSRAIEFVGLSDPYVKVATLGAGQRRLVEVARAVVGSPRLILLDEPAAGLPDEETEHLSNVIKAIPGHTGALVILVDHDMGLVSAVCETRPCSTSGSCSPPARRLRSSATNA